MSRHDLERASGNRCFVLAGVLVLTYVAILGVFQARLPFPITDGFALFVRVSQQDWPGFLRSLSLDPVQWRPLYYSLIRALHDLGGGPNRALFRAFDFVVLLSIGLLLLKAMAPRNRASSIAAIVACSCAFGHHTFRANTLGSPGTTPYAVFAVLFLLSIVLATSSRRSSIDVLAVTVSFFAVFLLELGLLIPVVFVGAHLLGYKRVSRAGAIASIVVVVAYFGVRFWLSSAAAPGAFHRDTGFAFDMLDVSEQEARFGHQPGLLYLYNVAATLGSLILSEPVQGRFDLLRGILTGEYEWYRWIALVGSALSSVLIGAWLWKARQRDDQMIALLLLIVILLNCAFGFLYTRPRIITAAGLAYAMLLFYALRHWISAAWDEWPRRPSARLVAVAIVLIGLTWSARSAAAVFALRDVAWEWQAEWSSSELETARLGEFFEQDSSMEFEMRNSPRAREIWERMRGEALGLELSDPTGDPAWIGVVMERRY